MPEIILHSDLNCFYASVEMNENPALRGKAIAVCGSTENRHGIVLTASYPAKRMGVKTAETIWQAKRKCPDLICLQLRRLVVTSTIKLYHQTCLRAVKIHNILPYGLLALKTYGIKAQINLDISRRKSPPNYKVLTLTINSVILMQSLIDS